MGNGPKLAFALGILAGCNRYENFRVAGYQQESYSNDADVLFVIDNSSSMQDESEELALNFDTFIRQLTSTEGATDGLADAVANYVSYVQNRSSIVDYQLAITTTDVENTYGALYGDPPILENSTPGDVATLFDRNLLCEATCFADVDSIPHDASYACDPENPDPPGAEVSQEYLTCLCGGGTSWQANCGAGTEEHLEAVFMAMCRAVDDPPEACFEENQFTDADIGSNAGLIRENSTVIPIIVTDEGDTSRRMSQGDGDPDEYNALFSKFQHRMAWAVIGPTTEQCNSGGATTWGVERLKWFVDDTNGRYFDIAEPVGDQCAVTDFATAMEELGKLLNQLLDEFVLQSVPDVDSIVVFVDGDYVGPSVETTEDDGTSTFTDGWSYNAADNAIAFHGTAIPDYNQEVRIYYLPLQGMPRELPF
jgi:hypothetical protein